MHEIAYQRKDTPYFQYLFELENIAPELDFKKENVFFIGIHESGSCPSNLEKVELNSDTKTITIKLSISDSPCTSDATPRTFVIQLDQGKSKDIESVVIIESGTETRVPLD